MPSTWTSTLPTGTTKIRMLPNICRDRWENIELGEVPSDKWQLQQQAGNPTSIPGAGLLYTKQGGGGNTELFYEDDDAPVNVVRLTRRGDVGYFGQNLVGDAVIIKPGATEITNTQKAFCCAFGFFSSQGANGTYSPGAGSYNITNYERTAAGEYKVNLGFTSTGLGLTYVPNVTVRKLGSGQMWTANIIAQTTTSFTIQIFETTIISGAIAESDADFCVSIFGAFT